MSNSAKGDGPPIVPVFAQEASDAVARFAEALNGEDLLGEGAIAFEQYYRRNPEQVFTAFSKIFDSTVDSEPATAVIFGGMLSAAADKLPGGIRENAQVARVRRFLIDGLRSADGSIRRMCALHFAYQVAPDEDAFDALIQMVRSRDPVERILAASACAFYDASDIAVGERAAGPAMPLIFRERQAALGEGLQHSEPTVAAIAARGVLRVGDNAEKELARQTVISLLVGDSDPNGAYHCAEVLEQFPDSDGSSKSALSAYVLDGKRPIAVRCMAARSLVRMAGPDDVPLLLSLFGAEDIRIVEFVILALKERPPVGLGVARCLAERWLSAADAGLRQAAALVIGRLPGAACEVENELMARVGIEMDCDVIEALSVALSRASDEMIPRLVAQVTTRNVAAMAVATGTLRRCGRPAAQALVSAIRQNSDPWLRSVLIAVLRDTEHEDEAIVRDLAEILKDSAEDPGVFVIQAIMGAGKAAKAAAAELVHILITRDGAMAEWAEKAIRSIGDAAILALDDAAKSAGAHDKPVLDRCRHYVQPIDPKLRRRMQELGDDTLVIFAQAGLALLAAPKHLADLVDLIRRMKREGKVCRGLPCSPTAISRAFGAVRDGLARGRAVVRSHGKHPLEITPLGLGLVLDVQKYCTQIGLL